MSTTKEMEFFELRQQLKEKFRKKMSMGKNHDQQFHGVLLADKPAFGSFFGPSHTVISRRVIRQASELVSLQNKFQRLNAQLQKKNIGPVKIDHQEKIQKLRESRDYSFLFSDDHDGTLSRKLIVKPSPTCSNIASKENNTSSGSDNTGNAKKSLKIRIPPSIVQRWGWASKAPTAPKQEVLQQSNKTETMPLPMLAVQDSLKMGLQQPNKAETRPMPKQAVHTSLKSQPNVSDAPLKNSCPKRRPNDQYLRKKYHDDEHEDVDEAKKALSMIKEMFNTQRFMGRDDSDIRMEASYQDILKEERKSAKLARKEDREQLRLTLEEERKEKAMKRKLSHH